jgi:hypothetical protein
LTFRKVESKIIPVLPGVGQVRLCNKELFA